MASGQFVVKADGAAHAWLASHRTRTPLVIAYDVHRCCGGGKLCQAEVRELATGDNRGAYVTGALDDGTEILIDPRAARRLPSRFGLTVAGRWRFKHLDLVLDAEQWGELLYT